MSQKRTQLELIRRKLVDDGFITRNECLKMYITRLGARINDLLREGWEIRGEYVKTPYGKDYKYTLIRGRMKRVAYSNPATGEILAIKYEAT